jgi:site-specific DNA-methyltransferase (adenine-specific)
VTSDPTTRHHAVAAALTHPRVTYADPRTVLIHDDCLTAIRALPENSIDAVITDPPYGLSDLNPTQVTAAITAWATGDRDHVPDSKGFMGTAWDGFVPPPAVWDAAYRALKPGGYMLVFAGSRTVDLMGLSIRLAGFDIRDTLTWITAAGFPKATDLGKMIDKADNATREHPDTPATAESARWTGWATALKPTQEPIIVARKPFKGSVTANVRAHGTGAFNIDATRVPFRNAADEEESKGKNRHADFDSKIGNNNVYGDYTMMTARNYDPPGRWPSNTLLTHAPTCTDEHCDPGCPITVLDSQSGIRPGGTYPAARGQAVATSFASGQRTEGGPRSMGDIGGASRFFPTFTHTENDTVIPDATDRLTADPGFRYTAKAPTKERPTYQTSDGVTVQHETVKPLAVMRWLVDLLVGGRPDAVVLEPFAGSGTTVEAAINAGVHIIAIERNDAYHPLIHARITRATGAPPTQDKPTPIEEYPDPIDRTVTVTDEQVTLW